MIAIRRALEEDLRYGPDATSLATVPADSRATARLATRSDGVVAGLPLIGMVLTEVLGDDYSVTLSAGDGDRVSAGDVVAEITAPTRGLLTAERTLLNLVCHLSGVATATRAWADELSGTGCAVRDTRKTMPGMRLLQKYAVRCGGGVNHRLGLGDAVLVKDNHVVAAGGVVPALAAVRERFPDLPCEVEVDSLEQLDQMLDAGVDLVLLDNFPVWQTQMAVQRRNAISPRTRLESSGGLGLDVAADYARCGVDFLAVGGLTHSVAVLDLGLDM
ncbi:MULTISPECIES: carboxylating nicotinate-nucleotide diphosphorylase [unclassified Dietzia]|uniref:carboxylating nicotinate-nucleotide diphosphorylase n=1 Tax=unclassified Dietzia TaxID=2617939 RepID=UPI0015FC47B2|nr:MULTISPECIES: carboxylating nicotinate-nucleotide diphosphorylase [unclassified Dietzia]MBB1041350.1 carboxylating nicotinate-nucleotide diphosphorylase [Dietzia sp. Cai40]MBB1045368.1 carboxylating nicotinate-nucleotide diphosphorylase [Dietzia sp. DQ11-44]MBB1049603.1 carboxylating nicotinate-nucleotide diphosphorylase [Dietzia sp. CW19]MBB1054121.1 carboxylating nicotinate-nucleotide diphosphorylase [Dietzia sp. B44]MBB1058112.1 carboxylating nicotinate-nucleotide diphosphorylase [Dietzi